MTAPAEQNTPASAAAPPAPRRRALRWLLRGVAALLALVLVAGAGFWWWAGQDGSLARTLGWAKPWLPQDALSVDGLQGALRRNGQAAHIRWNLDGLTVDVYDAQYRWNPLALLQGKLLFNDLQAREIRVNDERPPPAEPSTGPPPPINLPLGVDVQRFRAGKLQLVKPNAFMAEDVAGRYRFDHRAHELVLDSARIAEGSYKATVNLTNAEPGVLNATLSGDFVTPASEGVSSVPLSVRATVKGPLTELRAEAQVRGAAPHGQPADKAPRADARARITPWAAQPLPEAQADFAELDVAPFWKAGPATRLTGRIDLAPLPAAGEQPAGWAVKADVRNALPGPWDQRRLPLDQLTTDAQWRDGVALVRALRAELAGGVVETTGQWSNRPQVGTVYRPVAPESGASAETGRWQLKTQLAGVNPARLHTQLAPFPLDGQATVSGAGGTDPIDFDVDLRARAQRATGGDAAAQALARDLAALKLQSATGRGRWHDGVLQLADLRVRTDDATLTAKSVEARPAAQEGKGQVELTAPGARVLLDGDVRERAGGGRVNAAVADLAQLLNWAAKLPGAPAALKQTAASGNLQLDGSWQGGWADPLVKAQLRVPRARWQDKQQAATQPIELSDVTLDLNGRLAQAQIKARGAVRQGDRRMTLNAALDGGRARAGTSLATSTWAGTLQQLELVVVDPALIPDQPNAPWRVASRAPVSFNVAPAPGAAGGVNVSTGAGEVLLTSPAIAKTASRQATIAWQPVRWANGELATQGRVTGLPLAWAELLGVTRMQSAGVTGDVVFDGRWDANIGQTMRIQAELARASGDLTLIARDPETGVDNRIAAGLRDARVVLDTQGQAVALKLLWDSERAGTIQGDVRSQLSTTRAADGSTQWAWPESAPLSGQVRVRLPRIATYSVLAPPGWRLRGSLAADVQVAGTRAAPQLSGPVTADDLALRSVVDGIEFSDGRLRARLDGMRVLVDEFTLRGGGKGDARGSLRATGQAELVQGQVRAQMNATLDKLRASLREDRRVTVSGNLRASVAGRDADLSGNLRLDEGLIVLPDESAPSLGPDVIVRGAGGRVGAGQQAASTAAQPSAREAQQNAQDAKQDPARLKVALGVDLGPNFRITGQGIDTRLAGTLQLNADGPAGSEPRIVGTVNTVGGTFRAYSQNLRIQTGTVRFTGPMTNPSLNILALRPNYQSDQRVGVQVTGTALLYRVRLYSQPQLSDNETLAWLILGRAAPAGGAEAAMLQQAALAALGGRDGRSIASRLGLDELSFGSGADGGGSSVTLGRRLSERLYATYEHSLAGAMGTVFIYYELSKRWLLRGQAGERMAVDLIYTLSFD